MAAHVTLFHIWPSLCSQKARLVLVEKGVPYAGRIVNIGPPMENYEPWYVRLNPAAVVPTLQHGERVVTDSLRILRYVDDNFDGPPLHPEDPALCARADALLARMDQLQIRTLSYAPRRELLRRLLHRVVGMRARRLERHRRRHPELAEAYDEKLRDVRAWRAGIFDEAAVAAARDEVRDTLATLEESLAESGGPFLLGARYTLVDVMATVVVARVIFLGRGALLVPHERLAAWYQRARARPSFAAASVTERVDKGQMAGIMLPWLLPRLAALALALGCAAWAVAAMF